MDVHVPYGVTSGLISRGIDVLTAQWDGTARWLDPALLDRATGLGRVLVTQDDDLLAEANRRQTHGIPFAGIIYAHQNSVSVGKFIGDLELIASICQPGELENRVEFLPL